MVKKKKKVVRKTKKRVRKLVKKISGKKVKKVSKNVKKTSVRKPSVSRRDFETFKFGVTRLNELKEELNLLDTRGFNREEKTIRAKLKNVSEIPNIERGIKELRLKIRGKYKPRRRIKSRGKLIQEDIQDLKGEIKKIGRKVKVSKTPVDSGVGVLVDSNFNNFLKEIKSSLSNRVKVKEKEMDDLLSTDLNKRESNFKEKRLNLIREFNGNKQKLEKDFEKRYSTKVKRSLRREVSEKFNFMLKRKLDSEKIKLSKQYMDGLKENSRINLERHKQIMDNKLKNELANKMNSLENKYRKEMMSLQREEQKEKEHLREDRLNLNRIKDAFSLKKQDEEKKLLRKLALQEEALEKSKQAFVLEKQDEEKKLLGKVAIQEEALDKSKQDFTLKKQKENEGLGMKILKAEKNLQSAKQKFLIQKETDRKLMKEKLVNEAHNELENELAKKEKVLRERLRNEFDLKLRKNIQEHEQELKKRKSALELEMRKKIKKMLD